MVTNGALGNHVDSAKKGSRRLHTATMAGLSPGTLPRTIPTAPSRRWRCSICLTGPNDIEFSGERKRVRCNEGLGAVLVDADDWMEELLEASVVLEGCVRRRIDFLCKRLTHDLVSIEQPAEPRLTRPLRLRGVGYDNAGRLAVPGYDRCDLLTGVGALAPAMNADEHGSAELRMALAP